MTTHLQATTTTLEPITAANFDERLKAWKEKKKPDRSSSVSEHLAYTQEHNAIMVQAIEQLQAIEERINALPLKRPATRKMATANA